MPWSNHKRASIGRDDLKRWANGVMCRKQTCQHEALAALAPGSAHLMGANNAPLMGEA